MITLYTFGPALGLPDPSPFVNKTAALLTLAGKTFQRDTKGFSRAPKGKLPYIDDDGTLVADSTLIRLHLEQRHGIDFDQGLTPAERGTAWAFEKMLEEHLYFAMVYERWMIDDNFNKGPAVFFSQIPALVRPLIVAMIRRKLAATLKGQGIARHTRNEIVQIVKRDIDAVSDFLGDKPCFMGAQPCGVDATVFAFVQGMLCPVFDSELQRHAASKPNLVAYVERLKTRFDLA